jgi:DNA repair protein RadB
MWVSVIEKILTGCSCIDSHLNGGISAGSVTLIYGEPETGKSTLSMQCAVNCGIQGYKTLFVDCDNTFSAKRLSQIAAAKFEEIADHIILVKPTDFKQQTALIDRIAEYTAKNFGLIVVDTLNSLYRAKVAESTGKAFGVNRELNRQLAILAQTAKTRKLPVVVTSQVRSIFDTYNNVAPVATRVLKFWADTIIAMKPTEEPQTIKAMLEGKNSGKTENPQETACYVTIDETGIHDSPFYE